VSTSHATSSTSAWLYVALRPSSLTVKLEYRTSAACGESHGTSVSRRGSCVLYGHHGWCAHMDAEVVRARKGTVTVRSRGPERGKRAPRRLTSRRRRRRRSPSGCRSCGRCRTAAPPLRASSPATARSGPPPASNSGVSITHLQMAQPSWMKLVLTCRPQPHAGAPSIMHTHLKQPGNCGLYSWTNWTNANVCDEVSASSDRNLPRFNSEGRRAAGGHLAGVQERLALSGAEPGRHRDDAVHRRLALRGGLRDAPRVLQDARLRNTSLLATHVQSQSSHERCHEIRASHRYNCSPHTQNVGQQPRVPSFSV